MISEPSGLPDQHFHRHQKPPLDKDNALQKKHNEIINNNTETTNLSSKNGKENNQGTKDLQPEISSTAMSLINNEYESNENNQQKKLKNDENSSQNDNKIANILESEFSIINEATFISQSDYYKEDANKIGVNINENDKDEEENDYSEYEEEETKGYNDFEEDNIKDKKVEDDKEYMNEEEEIIENEEEEIIENEEEEIIKNEEEEIIENEEEEIIENEEEEIIENEEEENIDDEDFIETEEEEIEDKAEENNEQEDNTGDKNFITQENNEDIPENKEKINITEKEKSNDEHDIEKESSKVELNTNENEEFSESPSNKSNLHSIYHNKFSITSTVLVDTEPAKNFRTNQNNDAFEKEEAISTTKEETIDKEDMHIKIGEEKEIDKEFFKEDLNEKEEANNEKILKKTTIDANEKQPYTFTSKNKEVDGTSTLQSSSNKKENNQIYDTKVFQTSSNEIEKTNKKENNQICDTKVFQTSSNEIEKTNNKSYQISTNNSKESNTINISQANSNKDDKSNEQQLQINKNNNSNEDQKSTIYKEIAEEAINNNNYSRITSSNFEEVINNVRTIQKTALNDGDYELADRSQKAVNGIVRHVNNLRFLQFSEAKTVEMNEQLKATQNDLNDLKEKWKKVMSNAKMKMNEELENLRNENEKEINNFDKKMKKNMKNIKNKNENDEILDKDDIPIEYRKVSPEVLQLRSRQRAMIVSKRYKEAQKIKEEADKLEKIEIERNYERYVKKMQSKRNELIKKQENKVFVRKQNWEKNIQEIKRVSSLEISHAQKCANQLEKKIESNEEFNMTIRSPRKAKITSKNDNSNNAVVFSGNQKFMQTAAVAKISEKAELSPRIIRNKKSKRERAALQFRQRALINKVTYSNLIVQPKVKKPRSPR